MTYIHQKCQSEEIARNPGPYSKLFHLPNGLVQNISLPNREIVFTGTSNAPCKLNAKANLDVSYRFDKKKDIFTHLPE
jgi:hypothetical protein